MKLFNIVLNNFINPYKISDGITGEAAVYGIIGTGAVAAASFIATTAAGAGLLPERLS